MTTEIRTYCDHCKTEIISALHRDWSQVEIRSPGVEPRIVDACSMNCLITGLRDVLNALEGTKR